MQVLLYALLAPEGFGLEHGKPVMTAGKQQPFAQTRRRIVSESLLSVATTSGVLSSMQAESASAADSSTMLSRSVTYLVTPDSSAELRPSLKSVSSRAAVDYLTKGTRGVFLGEHHDASADHYLQAELIRSLSSQRKCCVGLEAIQCQFQPALDAYCDGKVSADEMRQLVEWDTRWVWPFERYEPVFEACKQTGTKLLALNVDSEDLALVERGGYANLDNVALAKYLPEPELFKQFADTTAFKEYVRYVIEPSYNAHAQMGILKTTITGQKLKEDMPFKNFFSGRMLWDSSMAAQAAQWAQANPTGLFVGLVGADHVKFGCGVPARFALALDEPLENVKAVLLNPSPFDTTRDLFATEIPPFTLQLRFAAQGAQPNQDARQTRTADQIVLPLADLLWLGGE